MAKYPRLRIKYSEKAYQSIKAKLISRGEHYKLPYVGPYILVEVGAEHKIHAFCTGRKQAVHALKEWDEMRKRLEDE